jgi:hypothetical protein
MKFSISLKAQNVSYNPETNKIEINVDIARELATVVIERDTLIERNKQLRLELNDAIGDIGVLLNDYQQTLSNLSDLRTRYEQLTSQIDSENKKEINYWKRMGNGLHLDVYLSTTVNDWGTVVAMPKLSAPLGNKWSVAATAIVPLNLPVNYLVGIGYRVF